MIQCNHKIGVFVRKTKGGQWTQLRCFNCNRLFDIIETMDHIEKVYGREDWQKYWVKLRNLRDNFKRQIKKGYIITTDYPIIPE